MKLGDFDTAAQYREAIRQASAEFSEELKKWKASHAEETIAVDEEQVADTVAAALRRGTRTVWVPRALGVLALVFRLLPRPVWRRLPR